MRSFLAAAAATALVLAPARASAETKRFALGMFHFNLQYVAGGLVGMGAPETDKSEKDLEDRIIVETFEPVLDLFLAHPTWGQDIELQGYMLEVLAQRHPAVLDKLRTLATRKQIDVVSFHYSDQFYIAYPRLDWERSVAMTKTIFEGAAVPLSTTVFCQEGQIGLGIAATLPDVGRKTLVWSKNNFDYQHPGQKPAALYTVGSARIVTTEPTVTTVGADTVESNWTFVDDGELLAAGGTSPYFNFAKQPQAMVDYEKKLADLEAQGFAIAPVARYVEALEALGVGEPPPPLLDGTWQPQVTNSSFKWMGGRAIFGADERDNEVRSLGAIAHRELVLAEAAARAAGLDAKAEIDAGWRLLALGEVSDATGITPIRNEVEYGLANLTEALRLARDVITRAKARSGAGAASVAIDAQAGTMSAASAPAEPAFTDEGPLAIQITAPDRDGVRVRWQKVDAAHWIANVEIPPGDAARVTVSFPGAVGDIVYTPALTSSIAHAPRSAFGFEQYNLPLWDGLIGLGNGRFLIKDTAFVHLAARVTPASGDVSFTDETIPLDDAVTWKFHVFDGDEAAAAKLAHDLNDMPRTIR